MLTMGAVRKHSDMSKPESLMSIEIAFLTSTLAGSIIYAYPSPGGWG